MLIADNSKQKEKLAYLKTNVKSKVTELKLTIDLIKLGKRKESIEII